MKKILAIVLSAAMLVSLLAVGIFAASAEEESAADWKEFWLTHYDDDTREGAGVVFSTAFYLPYWRCYGFKPVDGTEHSFEIVALETKDTNGSEVAVPAGGFVFAINTGNNWPQLVAENNVKGDGATGLWYDDPEHVAMPNYVSAGVTAMWSEIASWKLGDKFEIVGVDLTNKTVPTSTTEKEWYEEGYVCTAKFRPYDAERGEEDPNAPKPVKEAITVDGKLDDNGWAADGWTTFNKDNSVWQSAQAPENTDVSGKFQFRKDDTNLYVAAVLNLKLNVVPEDKTEANGCATNFRVWINDGVTEGATAYTHFYDAYVKGTATVRGYKNTDVTGNTKEEYTTSAQIAEIADPDDENKTIIELAIPLSEFNGADDKYSIFLAVSDLVGPEGANVCLFHPAITEGTENHLEHFPYRAFEVEKSIHAADIKALGEITPGTTDESGTSETEGPSYEETIKENMGPANENGKFEVELTGPQNYKAGEEIEITATVKNIAADAKLAQITFNLGFDTAKFELVNGNNDDGSLNLEATVPANWENLSKKGEEDGVVEVNFTNATNATDLATKDGDIVIKFKLKAKADATGEAGVWLDNETIESNDPDFNQYLGNGSYLIITAEQGTTESSETAPASSAVQTGDGSVNVIVLAIIALVAVVGCAVVIKTRR